MWVNEWIPSATSPAPRYKFLLSSSHVLFIPPQNPLQISLLLFYEQNIPNLAQVIRFFFFKKMSNFNITSIKTSSNGVWQGDNPLDFAFPLLIVQTTLILVLSRFLAFLLKPLRQPKVIAEIVVRISLPLSLAYICILVLKLMTMMIMINSMISGGNSSWTVSFWSKQRLLAPNISIMEYAGARNRGKHWASFLPFPCRSRTRFKFNSSKWKEGLWHSILRNIPSIHMWHRRCVCP